MDSLMAGILIVVVLLFYRNGSVRRERDRVMDEVFRLCAEDIEKGFPYEWRLKALEETGYVKMVVMFWKPVKSFFRGHSCLL